jgi:hypothetical protein
VACIGASCSYAAVATRDRGRFVWHILMVPSDRQRTDALLPSAVTGQQHSSNPALSLVSMRNLNVHSLVARLYAPQLVVTRPIRGRSHWYVEGTLGCQRAARLTLSGRVG